MGDLDLAFLHEGIPQRELVAEWRTPARSEMPMPGVGDWNQELLNLLSSIHLRSREDVIRRYDHLVQGGTVVAPLVGLHHQGPGDAAVIVPQDTWKPGSSPIRGVALGVGINPRYGLADPYAMAWAAVDEAIRNVVAVGADPEQVSILDNFCWGSSVLKDRLGDLVRCARGCHDAALAFGAPFISGKDSLNNEYTEQNGQRHVIPGTLLISSLAIVPDVSFTCTMDFKASGNVIYLIGNTDEEVGGSVWSHLRGWDGGSVPGPRPDSPVLFMALHRVIRSGIIRSCHDLSEGGLLVALAEMCLAGEVGATIDMEPLLNRGLSPQAVLVGESNGRFLVEISPEDEAKFLMGMGGHPHMKLGYTTSTGELRAQGPDISVVLGIRSLDEAFRGHI